MNEAQAELVAAAREAAEHAHAPYSWFHVGAALLFEDGAIITGSNVENASYGLSLCAETVAVAKAMNQGRRGGLVAAAVTGPHDGPDGRTITPCGRCRQVLYELAALGGTDPEIWCDGAQGLRVFRLSQLLPEAFGPPTV